MILVETNPQKTIEDSRVDKAGRWAIVKLRCYNQAYTMVGYYGPNLVEPTPFGNLLSEILDFSDPVIMAGDFNVVLDGNLDRSTKSRAMVHNKTRSLIKNSIKELGWCDIWRERKGALKSFTFNNKKYRHQSRIDLFLINQSIKDQVRDASHVVHTCQITRPSP